MVIVDAGEIVGEEWNHYIKHQTFDVWAKHSHHHDHEHEHHEAAGNHDEHQEHHDHESQKYCDHNHHENAHSKQH